MVPNLDGAVSEDLNLELNRGYLKVDENYQTSIPRIYAAGDKIVHPNDLTVIFKKTVTEM